MYQAYEAMFLIKKKKKNVFVKTCYNICALHLLRISDDSSRVHAWWRLRLLTNFPDSLWMEDQNYKISVPEVSSVILQHAPSSSLLARYYLWLGSQVFQGVAHFSLPN